MAHILHEFKDPAALADALAAAVADKLVIALGERGRASLAVSGGSTPKAFFESLSNHDLDWTRIVITLVDERFVPADHERSNHLLVKTHLLKNKAASATVVPLYYPVADIETAARSATAATAGISAPFDVVILGMGADGHTASFFPGGDHLQEALDVSLPRRVMTMQAPGAGEPRLTFSYSALADAGFLVLHIEGPEKKAVLEKALSGSDVFEMPIRAVLQNEANTTHIYWA